MPAVLAPATQYTAVTLVTDMTIALAWNVVVGYGGQLSLGVGAFTGVGAYACGLAMVHLGWGWLEAGLAGLVVCAAFGLVVGLPLLRVKGAYFAVATLVVAVGLQAGAQLWTWAGGGSGFTLPIAQLPSDSTVLRAGVVVLVVALATTLYVQDSRFGLRLRAVRDDEQAAAGLGIATSTYRLVPFVASGILMGLAGQLSALQSVSVSPAGSFSMEWTINASLFVVAGGIGTAVGPLLGVILVYLILTQGLQNLGVASSIIEGVLLVAVLRFAPSGIWPTALSVGKRLESAWKRRAGAQGMAADKEKRQVHVATASAVRER